MAYTNFFNDVASVAATLEQDGYESKNIAAANLEVLDNGQIDACIQLARKIEETHGYQLPWNI